MIEESKKRQEITFSVWYEEGYQDALQEVEKLLHGIGVKVQSTTYPNGEKSSWNQLFFIEKCHVIVYNIWWNEND